MDATGRVTIGVNSILCNECNRWCHKRYSGLRNLNGVTNFRCLACVRRANEQGVCGGGALCSKRGSDLG